jgi:[ribosomal protein S18]-alanine N-acetyltransferase
MNDSNYILRDYKPADYHAVNLLWNEIGLGGVFRGDTPEVIERTLSQGGKLIVVETIPDKKMVGTSWITTDGRRAYLHHFGIRPAFRRKGIAKTLLAESITFAKEKRLQIKLEVHTNNKEAISLYQKYGFKYLGEYDVYIIRNPIE